MTKANELIGQTPRTTAAGAGAQAGAIYGAFGPVMRSAIGVVRESARLVRNVAGLDIALVLDTNKAAPRRLPGAKPLPVADATNVIRFPVTRNAGLRNQRE
jgi:hypothetical protein